MRRHVVLTVVVLLTGTLVTVTRGDENATKTKEQTAMTNTHATMANVRYMVNDVTAALDFYTKYLGFAVEQNASPAFASVTHGNLRLLLSGENSSGRRPLPDGTKPVPGGWNRIELQVADLNAEAARLRAAGVKFRRDDVVTGPGGSQIWLRLYSI